MPQSLLRIGFMSNIETHFRSYLPLRKMIWSLTG